jgi:hypothetical protein
LRLAVSDREDPFAAVIRCTADAAKADKRTRSKWSRVMRYAVAYKPDSEPLDPFIKRKGGSAWGEGLWAEPRDEQCALLAGPSVSAIPPRAGMMLHCGK